MIKHEILPEFQSNKATESCWSHYRFTEDYIIVCPKNIKAVIKISLTYHPKSTDEKTRKL